MTTPVPVPDANAAAVEATGSSLRGRVISGSVWTLASYGASQVLRLGGSIVFTHLLYPEAMGLMTLVNVFVTGLAMFSDIGIGPSIIQSHRGEEPVFLNTAWTVQVVRGCILWIVSVIGARPFATWYGEPELAALVPVSALAALIAGFNSTRLFSTSRRIALGRLTLLDFTSQIVGLVTMVVLCFLMRNVWAIVIGALVGAASKMVLSFLALDGERNGFAWDREAVREMTRFGRWIFISTALSFLTIQIDRLMLGKLVPIGQLGIYSLATTLLSLPPMVAGALVGAVFYPLLAHHSRTDPDAYERALLSGRKMILEGAVFLLAGLALLSPALFRLLYDTRYADAMWIAQWLTIPMWTWILMLTAERAVLAVGDSKTMALANGTSFLCKAAACYFGFQLAGLPGFILGLALGFLAGHIPLVLSLRRRGIHLFKQDVPYTAFAALCIGGSVFLQRLVASHVVGRWRTGAEAAVAVAVLLPLGVRAAKIGKEAIRRR